MSDPSIDALKFIRIEVQHIKYRSHFSRNADREELHFISQVQALKLSVFVCLHFPPSQELLKALFYPTYFVGIYSMNL